MSLRAQQQYTALAVRGDELLHHREVSDAPPEWAQFDDAPGGAETGALDDDTALAVTVAELVDEVETGTADPGLLAVADTIDDDVPPPGADSAGVAGERPLPGDPAADPSVFGAGLPQPTADGLGEAEDTGPEKTVRAPRNARPSRFDIIGDE
jgi:hypothetical protein